MCTNRSDFDGQDVIYMLQYVDVILGSRCSRRVSGVYHFISSLSSAQYGSGYRTVNMFTWHGMNILKVSAPFMQKNALCSDGSWDDDCREHWSGG